MTRNIKLTIILVLVSLLLGGSLVYYQSSLSCVSDDSERVQFEVKYGDAASTVISNLYKANLIKNKFTASLYYKAKGNISFQAGVYSFNRTMDVETLFSRMNSGDVNREVTQLTFVEGKRLSKYVSQISGTFNFTEKEIYDTISDVTYLNELINKYWFLTDDILDDDIYYPLEGYLYPDTYQFEKSASIKEIIERMLDNTEAKLVDYKDDISNSDYSIHELMSMASIIELEGEKRSSERYVSSREKISQVIRYRLDNNWALGMDVTTYYAVKKDMTEVLYQYDLDKVNPYNTRNNDGSMNGKLPIGPICNMSIESIAAALNPSDTKYQYFVANVCTGEVFFQENGIDFGRKCTELRSLCDLN